MKTSIILQPEYAAFLEQLTARVHHADVSAARVVNRELVLLYWDIGQAIRTSSGAGWGDAIIDQIAIDLRTRYPDMKGFSGRNLWRMKQLYGVYTAPEFLSQLVTEIGRADRRTGHLAKSEAF